MKPALGVSRTDSKFALRNKLWHKIDWRSCDVVVSPITIILRFIFGGILAGGLALWWQLSFPINVVFALIVATIAAIWGDKFILGFMSFMRYFR